MSQWEHKPGVLFETYWDRIEGNIRETHVRRCDGFDLVISGYTDGDWSLRTVAPSANLEFPRILDLRVFRTLRGAKCAAARIAA